MKSLLELANDAPKLSQRDLDTINHRNLSKDRAILSKDNLQGMEQMENWGIP